ncbi:hypothetical protein R3P38DRAFT_2778516 [Favolaschia claudopus]|uniref:Uncharacterized protein n=1 Tax=Favolaschia claudopus TaxID=2862362 RepID=A0AAW0BI42_9AGAR
MPTKFTKTLASLNTGELLAAMADFAIAVPATYTVPVLKGLVKPHLTVHPELCLDDNYAALFTKKQRTEYIQNNPPDNSSQSSSSREASPWFGIEGPPPEGPAQTPPPPPPPQDLDVERQANLQLLESLPPDQLERALQAIFHPVRLTLLAVYAGAPTCA